MNAILDRLFTEEQVAVFNLHCLLAWNALIRLIPDWYRLQWWIADITFLIFKDADWEAVHAYNDIEFAVIYVDTPQYLGVPQYPRGRKLKTEVRLLPYTRHSHLVWGVGYLVHGSERFGFRVLEEFGTEAGATEWELNHLYLASGKE